MKEMAPNIDFLTPDRRLKGFGQDIKKQKKNRRKRKKQIGADIRNVLSYPYLNKGYCRVLFLK